MTHLTVLPRVDGSGGGQSIQIEVSGPTNLGAFCFLSFHLSNRIHCSKWHRMANRMSSPRHNCSWPPKRPKDRFPFTTARHVVSPRCILTLGAENPVQASPLTMPTTPRSSQSRTMPQTPETFIVFGVLAHLPRMHLRAKAFETCMTAMVFLTKEAACDFGTLKTGPAIPTWWVNAI